MTPTSTLSLHPTAANPWGYGRGFRWDIQVTGNSRRDVLRHYATLRRAGINPNNARGMILTLLHIGWMANAHRRTDRWVA